MRIPFKKLLALSALVAGAASAHALTPPTGPGPLFLEKMRTAVKDQSRDTHSPRKLASPHQPKASVEKQYSGMVDATSSFTMKSYEGGIHVIEFSRPQLSNPEAFYSRAEQVLKLTHPYPASRAEPTKLGLSLGDIDGYRLYTIDTFDVQYVFQPHWQGKDAYIGLTIWTNEPGAIPHYPR